MFIIKARGILWNIVLTNLTARFVGYFIIHVRWFCFLLFFFTLEYLPLENR